MISNKGFSFSRRGICILQYLLLILLLSSCSRKITQVGKASYYADKFQGRRTASGAIYRKGRRTAASRSIPFGTKVKVTNLKNGRQVKVRINDRGPFVKGRILDLSKKAARRLHMLQDGVVQVRIRYRDKR